MFIFHLYSSVLLEPEWGRDSYAIKDLQIMCLYSRKTSEAKQAPVGTATWWTPFTITSTMCGAHAFPLEMLNQQRRGERSALAEARSLSESRKISAHLCWVEVMKSDTSCVAHIPIRRGKSRANCQCAFPLRCEVALPFAESWQELRDNVIAGVN